MTRMMQFLLVSLTAFVLAFSACGGTPGVENPSSTKADNAVEGLVRICVARESKLTATTVVTEGYHGEPNAYIGVCEDGHVASVDD